MGDKRDLLIRMMELKVKDPALVELSARALMDWMNVTESPKLEEIFKSLEIFTQEQLGIQMEGEEYGKWLNSQPAHSTQSIAWFLYAMALWKAYEYRQSQGDGQ